MVKPDNWIRDMCMNPARNTKMIEPFVDGQVREILPQSSSHTGTPQGVPGTKVISYGLTSYGYDCRIGTQFKIFTNIRHNSIVDPKNFDERCFVDVDTEKEETVFSYPDSVIIPANSFALGKTVEWFRIPRDILVVCIGKSTYARCGIIVNVTPLEPEWEGYITLEISNTTPLPAKIYANEGICQLVFHQGDGPCDISYKDRKGKYQSQEGIVLPKV